jgi:sporulation protein YlmC with PRC-barrel domain
VPAVISTLLGGEMATERVRETLSGKEVVSSDGRALGHLKDVEVNTTSWKVTGLVVKLNRDVLEDVHLKKPFVGSQEIVIATAHVSGLSDKIILAKGIGEFGKLTAAAESDTEDDSDG